MFEFTQILIFQILYLKFECRIWSYLTFWSNSIKLDPKFDRIRPNLTMLGQFLVKYHHIKVFVFILWSRDGLFRFKNICFIVQKCLFGPNSTQLSPNSTISDQIWRSNLVEFKFRVQIWPGIWNSNSTFLVEFWIFLSQIWNSSELRMYQSRFFTPWS